MISIVAFCFHHITG